MLIWSRELEAISNVREVLILILMCPLDRRLEVGQRALG